MLASCCSFSPDGMLLVVGFESGVIMIFDTKMSSQKLEVNENYYLPKLEALMTIRSGTTPVLLAKFSIFSDFLAISYDNKRNKLGEYLSGSYLSIYIKQTSSIMNFKKRIDSDSLYIKVSEFTIPFSQFETSNQERNASATSSIDFSDDSKYILISSNKINELNKKNNSTKSIFLVWDIVNNQIVYEDNVMKNLKFPNLSVSKGVYARDLSSYSEPKYITDFLNCTLLKNPEEIKLRDKENIFDQLIVFYTLHYLNNYDSIVAGSIDGGIYIFNKLAIFKYEEDNIMIDETNVNHRIVEAMKDKKHDNSLFDFDFSKDDYATAKYFPAHCGIVSKIEVTNDNKMFFSSGKFDNNVIQWRVAGEDYFSDPSYFPIKTLANIALRGFKSEILDDDKINSSIKLINDPLKETTSYLEFLINNSLLWLMRHNISLQNKLTEKSMLKYYTGSLNLNNDKLLDLKRIIGRKARDNRFILDFDIEDNIIYSCSCFLIHLNSNTSDNTFQQTFTSPDQQNSNFKFNREINTFRVSKDKSLIAIGLIGLSACVSIWDLSARLLINNIELENCRVISILNFSFDNSKILGYAIHEEYLGYIFIVDVEQGILSHYYLDLDSFVFKIKDLQFLFNSNTEFITIGLQHISFWKVYGKQLIPFNLSLSDEKQTIGFDNTLNENNFNEVDIIGESKESGVFYFNNLKVIDSSNTSSTQEYRNPNVPFNFEYNEYIEYCINMGYSNDDIKLKIKTIFISLLILDKSILIGSHNGVVFFFSNRVYSHKIKYAKSSITSMIADPSESIAIMGCADGKLSIYNIEKDLNGTVIQLSIKGIIEDSCLNIKRLDFYSIKSIAYGNNKLAFGTASGDITVITLPKEILTLKAITKFNTSIEMSVSNVDNDPPISVSFDQDSNNIYLLTKTGIIISQTINSLIVNNKFFYDTKSCYIYHFQNRNRLLVAFFDQVEVLDTTKNMEGLVVFKKLDYFEIFTGRITDIKVSVNDQYLAVASTTNNNPNIHLYEILENGFSPINIFQGFASEIVKLDFDSKSEFLFLEDSLGNSSFIKFLDKKITTVEETQNVHWISSGLKYSYSIRCISRVYSDLSDVCVYLKHPRLKVVITGDKNGSVRFFNYPSSYEEGYFFSLNDHTGPVRHIEISKDLRFLATLSDHDRALYIYELNPDLIKEEESQASDESEEEEEEENDNEQDEDDGI